MSDQQSERAKFDAWLLRRAGPTDDEPGYPGPSAMFHDQELCAWEAWQARAALSAQAPSVPEDVPADSLRDVLTAVFREIEAEEDDGDGNAPGHGHARPGIWDDDNGELSGKPCAWCALWNKAKAMLAASPSPDGKDRRGD